MFTRLKYAKDPESDPRLTYVNILREMRLNVKILVDSET